MWYIIYVYFFELEKGEWLKTIENPLHVCDVLKIFQVWKYLILKRILRKVSNENPNGPRQLLQQ